MMMKEDDLTLIPLGRILAIDFGRRRIGIAVSDPTQVLASPLVTLQRKGEDALYREITRIVEEQQAVAIVVGNPLHMNGSAGESAREVAVFLEGLANYTHLPLILWDERWTTTSAHKSLLDRGKSPSKNRQQLDQIAAAFLLHSFLHRLSICRHRSPEPGKNREVL